MKYLVMECHPAYAVVLCEDGSFLKVANMRYEVGQEITDILELSLPQTETPSQKKPNRRWIRSLSGIAACFLMVITALFFAGRTPYASVYITINPEVRIDVNRQDIVIGVAGVNTDGADLLVGYDYSKKDLDTVVDELVDRAIDMGYLHEGGKVTLSLDANDRWIVDHQDHLASQLNDHLVEKITVTIDIEPKSSDVSAPTLPDKPIVIPVNPGYSDTDYGSDEEDYDDRVDTEEDDTEHDIDDDDDAEDSDSEDDEESASTDYDNHHDGMTDYDDPSEARAKESDDDDDTGDDDDDDDVDDDNDVDDDADDDDSDDDKDDD